MLLLAGDRLGRYEILGALGAGGMGEVYRARDSELERDVAVKVLAEAVAGDPSRLERFKREAKTISQLSHPHICTLHDVGQEGDVHFLVMEYLEGQSLADRLQKGKIPFDEALGLAAQIADALDAAHRQGVVHRDLKPGNIMLTRDGAKLLDFGLAKLQAPSAVVAESMLATEDKPLTAEGTLVGTIQYMAPEQLEGKDADNRTDLFAFGVVLYEMVTGRRAFEGKSQASLIGAIMNSEPQSISELQPMTPPLLERTVRKCLSKQPEKRWQTAQDLHDELKWVAEDGSEGARWVQETASQQRWRTALPWGLVVLMAVITAVASWRVWQTEPPAQQLPMRFAITPPEGMQLLVNTSSAALAISPDGQTLAYPLEWGISLHSMRTLETRHVAFANLPFFSPDSHWLGFFADGQLKKVSLLGGSPQVICEANDARGGSWGSGDQIVFAASGSLWRVAASGGTPERIAIGGSNLQEAHGSYCWPQFLPGGEAVLVTVRKSIREMRVVLISLVTGEEQDLIDSGTWAHYVPTGHVIYAWGNDILAVKFDLERFKVTGHSVPVVQDITPPTWTGQALWGVSEMGTLAYVPKAAGRRSRLVWVDRSGEAEPLPLPPALDYGSPRLSPNGRQLLFTRQDQRRDLWVYDLERQTSRRLTDERGDEWLPIWTPDGQRVVFDSNLYGGTKGTMYWVAADGSGAPERLVESDNWVCPHSCSPDGRLLAYREVGAGTGDDIWMLAIDDEERTPKPFLQTRFDESSPMFSPDGRWIIYTSNESGQDEVYVRPSEPGRGGATQVSNRGGHSPRWSPDGREVFYRSNDQLMVVSFERGRTPEVGIPEVLFRGEYQYRGIDMADYDVTPDGQRFVMIEKGASQPIYIVLNWFEELERLAPPGD